MQHTHFVGYSVSKNWHFLVRFLFYQMWIYTCRRHIYEIIFILIYLKVGGFQSEVVLGTIVCSDQFLRSHHHFLYWKYLKMMWLMDGNPCVLGIPFQSRKKCFFYLTIFFFGFFFFFDKSDVFHFSTEWSLKSDAVFVELCKPFPFCRDFNDPFVLNQE